MLSLAIDNTNTNSPRGERAAESPRFESVHGPREGHRPATYGQLVTAGETATHSNSRSSSRADMAGEAYPSQTRTSPATPFSSTGATVEAETMTSQAVSATYSTWSPWSVCKGSI